MSVWFFVKTEQALSVDYLGRPEIEPKTRLGARLREARQAVAGDDREAFANRLGIPATSIGRYERGDRVPDAEVLALYHEKAAVDVTWLTTGDGEMFAGKSGQLAALNDNFVMIPQFDIQAAAGTGLLAGHEAPASWISVDRDWLRRFLPVWAGTNAQLGILQGAGDSMSPTIETVT